MTPLKYRREMPHWTEFVRLAQARAYGGLFRPALLAMGALPIALAVLVSTLWPGWFDQTSFTIGFLIALLVVAALSVVIGPKRHVKGSGWVLGDREITLTDAGLVDSGNGTVLKVGWPAVEGVTVARNIIVLWIDRAAGVFIPRNAFASADLERSFVDFASRLVSAPRANPVS